LVQAAQAGGRLADIALQLQRKYPRAMREAHPPLTDDFEIPRPSGGQTATGDAR
jgi:hypothetical protein